MREVLAVWKLDLPLAVLYELKDGGDDATDREDNFGLIDATDHPKPAYYAIAQLAKVADDKHYAGHFLQLAPGMHAIRLDNDRGRGYTIVAWLDRPGATAALAVAGHNVIGASDLYGRPLRPAPASASPGHMTLSEADGPIYLTIAGGV